MYWNRASLKSRLLAMMTMLAAMFVIVAYILMKTSTKPLCAVTVSGGDATTQSAALDKACGRPVKLNTMSDIHYVILVIGIVLTVSLWMVGVCILIKRYLWDCYFKQNCDGSYGGELYSFYTAFGAMVLVILLPAFAWINSTTGRVCKDTTTDNCRSQSFTSSPLALYLVGAILMTLLTLVMIAWIVLYGDGE